MDETYGTWEATPTAPGGPPGRVITVTGLGPGDLGRIPAAVRSVLLDPGRTVIVRTEQHPAAEQLAALEGGITCDDLYLAHETFERCSGGRDRVLQAAFNGPVVYAVPGSPRR